VRRAASIIGLLATGCAPALLVGARPPREPMVAGPARVVVVEPLQEQAPWKRAPVAGGRAPATSDKALFSRPATLAALHERVTKAIGALRPSWTVLSPSTAQESRRPLTVVRVSIGSNELVASDRPLRNAAFAFGLVLLPLQLIAAMPVEETQRVTGQLEVAPVPAGGLGSRLVKFANQPDFAVNHAGLVVRAQPFALDIEYQEGLFADETPRPGVLLEGLVERLAFAVVTLIEEESTP
jgi:hypothetical protein